jgi:hypothetical protein
VSRHLAHDRIVLFKLQTIRRILAILLSHIPRSAGQTTGLVLRAFQNNLKAIALGFLCHNIAVVVLLEVEIITDDNLALLLQFFQIGMQPHLVDGTQRRGADLKRHPLPSLRHEKLLFLQVGEETALRLAV